MSLQSYVAARPTGRTDPSGLKCVVCKWYRSWQGETIASLDAQVEGQPVSDAVDSYVDYLNRKPGNVFRDRASVTRMGHQLDVKNQGGPDPAGSMQASTALFVVAADVAEDNPGDCWVSVNEKRWAAAWSGTKWVRRRDAGGSLIRPPGTPTLGTERTYGKLLKPTSCCTKRIFVVDMPDIRSYVTDPPGIFLTAAGAGQIYEILDASSGNAVAGWCTQKFAIKTHTFSPYASLFEFTPGASGIGTPPPW